MNMGVYRENMLRRQLVFPLDFDPYPTRRLKDRAGILPFVPPKLGSRQLRVHPLFELFHAYVIEQLAFLSFNR